jgi:hypothetical protein
MGKRSKSTTRAALVEPVHTIGDYGVTAEMTKSTDGETKMIKVSPQTHAKLLKIGSKGETFDKVIQRLIQEHEERERSKY